MTQTRDRGPTAGTKGRILHSAVTYDLLAWLLFRGRERAFRDRLVVLARLAPGQSVLDIGCGTGSLAMAAKRCLGSAGRVQGIDASPEMIARARRKASKSGIDVSFTQGVVESLPFPHRHFDRVLSTVMLHHLPRPAREQCAREIRRVLKPGGLVLAVDFGTATGRSRLGHFHRHGGIAVQDIVALLDWAGLEVGESGAVGIRGLNFVVARSP